MATTSEKRRAYAGPEILSYGFRPLFFLAGLWAAIAMIVWIASLSGLVTVPTAFAMADWHVHELLFGYLPAVAAGFLLTAVPNWTGRLPVIGTPLLILALIWLAGRIAILSSLAIGIVPAAIFDLMFLAVLSLVIGREIVGGRNWRNLKVLVLIALLFCANLIFHVESATSGNASGGYGAHLGIALAVTLIIVIGGRVIPSFTRNWLARRGTGRLPAPYDHFDTFASIAAIIALLSWVFLPEHLATAILCLIAGALHLARLLRWAGERTLTEPLVWILHLAYAFVPLGFFLVSAFAFQPHVLPQSAALHAWTAGAIGLMTLAVMTRASLGHSGKALHATMGITAIYVCVFIAVISRILSGIGIAPLLLLDIAGAAWIAGYALFTIIFAPLYWRKRTS